MANPEVQINQKQVDPSLADLLALVKKDILLSTNCHAIGTIQSFNADNQTVSVTLNYKKSYLQRDANGLYTTKLKDYPPLLDVPVFILGGGPVTARFPITAGDECLLCFNDRSIDAWFQSGQVGPVTSSRLHSFTDAIALVGLKSLANSIEDYDTTRAGLVWADGAMVLVSASKVKIANQITTLNTLLASLIDALNAITTTNAVVGNPSLISPASQAALTAIKTQIAGLLE